MTIKMLCEQMRKSSCTGDIINIKNMWMKKYQKYHKIIFLLEFSSARFLPSLEVDYCVIYISYVEIFIFSSVLFAFSYPKILISILFLFY